MKKLLVLVILLSLLIPFGVFAKEQPLEPVCPEGTIETVPAEWIDTTYKEVCEEVVDVPGHYIYTDKIVDEEGHCGRWWWGGACTG